MTSIVTVDDLSIDVHACLSMPGLYRFSGSLLALSVFMCDPIRGYSGHLDFIIFFYYWHSVLAVVVSNLRPF